jgi:hypothetical protein
MNAVACGPALVHFFVRRLNMPTPIIDCLLDNAYQDTQVLLVNEKEGDEFAVSRDVEFIFRTDDKAKAETVSGFIRDNRYADSVAIVRDGQHSELRVTIHMPLRQPILCSVSALMASLGQIFDIEYDGWSADIKRAF